jgi:4-amino-4-deoxy-L-arabinose transferase-like glycosyltransferase
MTESAPAPEAETIPGKSPFLAALAKRPYLVLTLLCLLLWTPGILSLPALDRDESRFAQSSRQMVESGDLVDIRFGHVPRYKKPVGIYWLQAGAAALTRRVTGDDGRIWSYRLPSLAGGIIAVWLTFWTASAIAGAEVALVAALLLLSSILLTAEATIATTDAVLLAAIMGAQGVLLRLYRSARDPDAPKVSTGVLLLGWASFAAGILIKGPAVAPCLATLVALCLWDRQWRWLAALQPVRGLLLTVVLVAPWLIAIALASNGAFFQQSLGNDFAAKIAGGQEGHGAWPGYFLALSAITFWPAILFAAPAIGAAFSRRGDPAIRFLLAWAGACWLMYEALPTKLPHYVLPAYPALAILSALWLFGRHDLAGTPAEEPRTATPLGPRLLRWVACLQFALGGAALVAAPLLLPRLYGGGDVWWLMLAAGLAAVLALTALICNFRGARLWALSFGQLAMFVLVPALTAGTGPRLTQLWVSERIKPLVPRYGRPGDPPPVLAGFEEPSLVFALGADTQLSDGAGAAALGAAGGGLALVEDNERGAFLAGLAERQADASALTALDGYNYSRGKPVHITLYRVTKVQDAP